MTITACGNRADDAALTAGPAPSTTRTLVPSVPAEITLPDLEQFSPAPDGVVDEDTEQTLEPESVPAWDEDSRTSAVAAAEAVMTAFARPQLDAAAWTAGIQPLLTTQGAADYAYVDPAAVPAAAVTGPGVLIEDTSAYVAGVDVPTDVGTYRIVLSRTDAASPWLAERISPPAELG